MEKALEILYALREAVSLSKNYPSDEILDEAIAELEEAMKPKTCDGCVREEEDMQDPHCAFCSRVCSDNFEAKDNA